MEFKKSEQPVKLRKCEDKPTRWWGQLEILVGKDTEVYQSEKLFKIVSLQEKVGKKSSG